MTDQTRWNLRLAAVIAAVLAATVAITAESSPDVMARFPVAWVDRAQSPEHRAAKDAVIWDAIKGFTAQERAAVLSIGYGESRWAEYVLHDCVTMPPDASGDCDRGRSRSYFQLRPATCPELFRLPKGTGSPESVKIAAECARRMWLFSVGRCRGVKGSFAAYGGRNCSDQTKSSLEKEQWFKRLGGTP